MAINAYEAWKVKTVLVDHEVTYTATACVKASISTQPTSTTCKINELGIRVSW